MQLSHFQRNGFRLTGVCPHCKAKAAFETVLPPFIPDFNPNDVGVAVAPAICIACNQFILAILKTEYIGHNQSQWVYDKHYPVGWPDDRVPDEIPDEIKPDVQEALRCRWVDAYNATVEMCRRALEASCIQQGAPPDRVLSKMIDWLFEQGRITLHLRDMAHKIRLGGNLGAHPSEARISKEEADAVLEFTDEYFHHIYTMPARMAKFNFHKVKEKRSGKP
jgi:hypothetical protein